MTPAAVLDGHRAEERLALWTDDPTIAPPPLPAAAPDAAAPDERLADVIEDTWSALEAGFASSCLLCGGAMRPRWSAGAGVVGGRCVDCGTELD